MNPMTDAQMKKLVKVLSDPEAAMAALPQAEREAYERAQQSVVDARRYAEAHAHEHFIY